MEGEKKLVVEFNKHGGCVSMKPETFAKQIMLLNVLASALLYSNGYFKQRRNKKKMKFFSPSIDFKKKSGKIWHTSTHA